MVLACSHIEKVFVGKTILEDVSFHIEDREKAALVGINGAGKSTLLKIIVGELSADKGNVTLAKGKSIGYLSQHQDLTDEHTILEALMTAKADILEIEMRLRKLEHQMKEKTGEELEKLLLDYTRLDHEFEMKNGYAYQSEITGILKGLGFSEEEFSKQVMSLSGGQKTRVALGKLLLTKPDVLLLDEPTNHLDLSSISWLETYLLNYPGAVVLVSHDRYFLDRVVTKVIEIDRTHSYMFLGNYSVYSRKKKDMMDALMKQYLKQQQEIHHQEAVIEKLRSFNREKSIKRAESREKMLDKIEVLEKPDTSEAAMHFELDPPVISGVEVLNVEGLSKSFDGQSLFSDISFQIRRGEHVALIGNNGTGKTTILKIINELIPPDSGVIKLGSKVTVAYYDQEHQVLHMEKTLFDEMSDTYPDMTQTQIRNVLAAFLFTGEDVYKQISELSGGERGRVSLAKLMLANANLLILDEPTNHLDILSKEILEQALNRYTGTVLYVSHDRYFINQTATRILELTGRKIVNYIGNYDYYLEKKDILSGTEETESVKSQEETASKQDWKSQKEQQAAERKKQNDLKKLEDRITELETKNSEIDEQLAKEEVYTDVSKLMELNKEKEKLEEELNELYEKWEEFA